MGQKIHPYSIRLGIIRDWQSKWLANTNTDWRKKVKEDFEIRKFLKDKLKAAYVDKILINRNVNNLEIEVEVARPGVAIGHKGEGMEKIKAELERKLEFKKGGDKARSLKINIKAMDKPDIKAVVAAKGIVEALEKRIPFRRAIKQTLDRVSQNSEVKGVKIQVSGRLDNADMARKEFLIKGSIPLQTLRADVDFARETAFTKTGAVGVKVWVYTGEIFD